MDDSSTLFMHRVILLLYFVITNQGRYITILWKKDTMGQEY